MKKLLVLVLVLAISTVGSAAIVSLQSPVVGPLAVGDTVTVNILASAGLYGLDAKISVVGGSAIIVGATNVANAASFGWDGTLSFNPTGIGTTSVEIGLGTFGAAPSGTVASVTVQVVSASGDFVLGIAGASTFGGSSDTSFGAPEFSATPIAFSVVPEPITVALLGLGGLFIRRRKVA